jgi:methanethiol S-methyltransferase
MKRMLVLLFGVVNYACFLGVFLYAVGFVGGFMTPTRLDGPLDTSLGQALAVNALLLLLFGLQHSVMARPGFKRLWTRAVPQPIERSTYVLFTNLALGLLFWQWRPLGGSIWDIQEPMIRTALWGLFALGWLTVLVTTFLINHFDLFGLRQVWLYFRGRPYTHLPFVTPGPYRLVRHPLYVGWLTAFWATPTMGPAHMAFALGMTAYILIAIQLEERDLVRFHDGYAAYRERTPMLIPRWGTGRNHAADAPFQPSGDIATQTSLLSDKP